MDLVTAAELQTLVDWDLDSSRATQLLDLASGRAAHIIGRDPTTAAASETYDGPGTSMLMLRRWPISAVESVNVTAPDGTETALTYRTDYRWSASGWLTRVGWWPSHEQSIRVTYTAGADADTLTAVKGIVLAAAARTAANPQQLDAVSNDGTSLDFTAAAGVLSFTPEERNDLRALA